MQVFGSKVQRYQSNSVRDNEYVGDASTPLLRTTVSRSAERLVPWAVFDEVVDRALGHVHEFDATKIRVRFCHRRFLTDLEQI